MRLVLRITHRAALGMAVLSLGAAALAWLESHPLSESSGRDVANFIGLLGGVILGAALLLGSFRSTLWNARVTSGLFLCWVLIFGWYWFNRFGATEIHSLDPQQVEAERIRQLIWSAAFFTFWALLCAVGPVLSAARKIR